ncbi:MAG: ATP-grasp domain-containing protein [Oligoflexia bacterium]|nr:ATP-grasp domain-containing protein [Oligoflexia bacterium]
MALVKKVAVANRGEIAQRIISTCHEMGLKTVLLYASGDTYNSAYRLADERICIGPADPLQSYLNISANIEGAKSAGASAIHPGYGFLSENPVFAKACEDNKIIFIGPSSHSISLFGNKIKAKEIAQKAGVPVLPSWQGDFSQRAQLIESAEKIGYPLMIKASCGGGGRGLRLAHNSEELTQLLPLVRQEAKQSFNSEEVFLEKYLESAKHIEAQIFISADKEIFILGDRDCSPQRRHQKIIESAPSCLPQKLKDQLQSACYELCSLLDYQGAGTVEFLVQGNQFYFLEMNTRLQVEHTVTEMIYGIDLVKAQILTAMGQPAFFTDRKMTARGYSIQCRVCAEDPHQNFLPSIGPLLSCAWPLGKNIRVDTAYHSGDQISSFYDSLISKVIVWEDTRTRAIEKMNQALKQTILFGVLTNIPFLSFLLSHKDFIEDQIKINSLEKIHSKDWKRSDLPLPPEFLKELFEELNCSSFSAKKDISFNPWSYFLNPPEK